MAFHQMRHALCALALAVAFVGCGTAAKLTNVLRTFADPDPQQLTPEGEAQLQNLLDSAVLPELRWPDFSACRADATNLYAAFPGTLPWIQRGKPTPQAEAMIRLFQNAGYKGLNPEDYDASRWQARLAEMARPSASESDRIRFDLAVTVSAIRYVSDLRFGRANPALSHSGADNARAKFDPSQFLQREIVASQNLESALASLDPPFPVYQRTQAALNTYLQLAGAGAGAGAAAGAPLPSPSKPIKPGYAYEAMPQLANRLELLGDMPGAQTYTGEMYDPSLVPGVEHFQQRHGLDPTGLIDAAMIREMNVPLGRRATQLALTMERLRWLPREFSRPPVVVNIPEFRLHADDDAYHWALSMKVVVGKAYGHETPVFASEITAVTFRPYWNVPYSITRNELIPHFSEDPSYLAANAYEIVDKDGDVVGASVNREITQQLLSGELRIRQIPGPKNSLGLLKFEIPSPYDVYMHGTPATELFARSRRDFSHGCIRVEDPVALAEWVLRDTPGWTEEKIRAAMNGDQTFQARLKAPIPVLVMYSTAVVMEDGEVRFFPDIYGLDAALEEALARREPFSSAAEPQTQP